MVDENYLILLHYIIKLYVIFSRYYVIYFYMVCGLVIFQHVFLFYSSAQWWKNKWKLILITDCYYVEFDVIDEILTHAKGSRLWNWLKDVICRCSMNLLYFIHLFFLSSRLVGQWVSHHNSFYIVFI